MIAVNKADYKLYCVIKMQAICRGFVSRQNDFLGHVCATMIGATWRRYAAQLCYQFDLVDIIIAQSIVRRRAAILRVQEKTLTLMESGAIVIQARWRCYDCTMNYLHSTADILIVQSVARRWIAMRTVHLYRAKVHYIAATTIQRYIRGWIT